MNLIFFSPSPNRSLPSQQIQSGAPPLQKWSGQCSCDCDRGRCWVSCLFSWGQYCGCEAEERICADGAGVWVRAGFNTERIHQLCASGAWTHWRNLWWCSTGLTWCLFTHSGRMSSFSRSFSQTGAWVGGYRTCSKRLWALPPVCSLVSAWCWCLTRFHSPSLVGRYSLSSNFTHYPARPAKSLLLSVGRPISVPKRATPTAEEVDHYHGLYMEALSKLFHEHKHSCGLPEDHKLWLI